MPDGSQPDHGRPIVLITGASAGLGQALARELVHRRKAATLILAARRLERLDRLAIELRADAPGLRVHTLSADLAEPQAAEQLASEVISRFGGLDVLINNAGLGLPAQFASAEPDQLARQIAVNFTTPLLLTRFLLPSLIERHGTIINIGSAITSVANSALGAYGATKAGLAYWNDALRRELAGTGVRICLVEPGPIRTEFFDALSSMVPHGSRTDPILDNAAPWMTADVAEVARRVAGLLDYPKRRLSILRRLVWPFRLLGALARICPPLGDLVVVTISRRPLSSRKTMEHTP